MSRFVCMGSVTDGAGEHQVGDVIELSDAQAASLLEIGKISAMADQPKVNTEPSVEVEAESKTPKNRK